MGVELGPHRRADAVGAHHHVSHDDLGLAGGPVAEVGPDLVAGLVEALQGEPGPHRFGAQPPPDRVQQHHLEVPPVDGVLRPAVTGALAPRLAPDQAPEAVVVGEGRGGDAGSRQPVGQPQLGQLPHRVGQEVDAHP